MAGILGNERKKREEAKKIKHETDEYQPTVTRTSSNDVDFYDTIKQRKDRERQKERVIRTYNKTRLQLKAMAAMGIYGTTIKDCIAAIVDKQVNRFDDTAREEYDEILNQIERTEAIKDRNSRR